MLTLKSLGTLLPLLILGYIFGTLLMAAVHGWHVNPLVVLLNGVGILMAIWECKERL